MDETTIRLNLEAPPGQAAPRPRWEDLERDLAAALRVLKDEFLILAGRTGNRYLQFSVQPACGLRAETVSNAYLEASERLDDARLAALAALDWMPPTCKPEDLDREPRPKGSPNFHRDFPNPVPWEAVARLGVRTLTEVLRFSDPSELEYRAFDRPGHEIVLPALRLARGRPAAHAPAEPPTPEVALGRLRRRVVAAVRRIPGNEQACLDAEGEVGVKLGRDVAVVRVLASPLFVRVYTAVVDEVEASEALVRRLHAINARLPLVRLILANGSVFAAVDFPAAPFHAAHLEAALSTLERVANEVAPQVRKAMEAPTPAIGVGALPN